MHEKIVYKTQVKILKPNSLLNYTEKIKIFGCPSFVFVYTTYCLVIK